MQRAVGLFSTSTVRRTFIRAGARVAIHGEAAEDRRDGYRTALYRVASATWLVKNLLESGVAVDSVSAFRVHASEAVCLQCQRRLG